MNRPLVRFFSAACLTLLFSACTLVQYQPLETISRIDPRQGYRLEHNLRQRNDEAYIVLMFSGGGSRAAALGYGVLEELNRQKVLIGGRETTLLDSVDLVYGVSGGSVLAAYYALHGKDAIPAFEQNFLKRDFQSQLIGQTLSLANLPRLASPEFGRGDLLQEQFENSLFGRTTFGDLAERRKGPFAVISATDMSLGSRFSFTQEYFDIMCLNLSKLPVARAVAASSAVPLVFAPLTLNNNGGNCGHTLPPRLEAAFSQGDGDESRLQTQTRREFLQQIRAYGDSRARPYIHLLDGGLTDNLGLRGLLDMTEIHPENMLRDPMFDNRVRDIVVISVNAQNQVSSSIDQSPAVPGLADVIGAVINVPIDQHSQESLRRFRSITDQWNHAPADPGTPKATMHFVSLNLRDLPESALRRNVLNISTSFQLPQSDVNDLKAAAAVLLRQSPEYARLLESLSVKPAVGPVQPPPSQSLCSPEAAAIINESGAGAAVDIAGHTAAGAKRNTTSICR